MKSKLVFETETKDHEFLTELPLIPRLNEWINVPDFLKDLELETIKQSALCWSGVKGIVEAIEYRRTKNEIYTEILVWCED